MTDECKFDELNKDKLRRLFQIEDKKNKLKKLQSIMFDAQHNYYQFEAEINNEITEYDAIPWQHCPPDPEPEPHVDPVG